MSKPREFLIQIDDYFAHEVVHVLYVKDPDKSIHVIEKSAYEKLHARAQKLVSALEYYKEQCRPCNSMYAPHEEGFRNDNLHGCDCLIARQALAEWLENDLN